MNRWERIARGVCALTLALRDEGGGPLPHYPLTRAYRDTMPGGSDLDEGVEMLMTALRNGLIALDEDVAVLTDQGRQFAARLDAGDRLVGHVVGGRLELQFEET